MAGIATDGERRANGWRMLAWGSSIFLLLLPLAAMQFDLGVNWTAVDFLVFGTMLLIACVAFELATRTARNGWYRAAAAASVAAGFLLVWVNLAVGALGDEDNRANLMFLAVLAVAIIGSVIARSRPAEMARAMIATAIAQALVGIIGLAAGWASPGAEGVYEVVMGTTLFGVLWLTSAWLFGKAQKQSVTAGSL